MKYLVALVLGVVAGIIVLAAALYFNPFAAPARVSPLAVSESSIMGLSYSVVSSESLILTNDGDSIVETHPDRVQELWEPAVRKSQAMVSLLTDRLGEPIGIGVKISSISEDTRIANSQLLVDSVWHVHLPGRGSFFVDQVENRWTYYHDIVIPAWWSSSDSWRGNWRNVMTVGPNALGTARVTGASGEFAGLETEAVETLAAKAFSVDGGPVAMTGNLTISMPATTASDETP